MAQRIDAVRNRKALIAAAEQVFAEHGPDAPLELVARRAYVGRGTLYRHFRDRTDLAAAVFEQHLGELEEFVAERAENASVLLELLTRIAALQSQTRGIQPLLLRAEKGHERLAAVGERTRRLFADPLATSQGAGVVSREITVEDLILVLDMLEGALSRLSREEAPTVARRALALLLPTLTDGPGAVDEAAWRRATGEVAAS